MTAPLLSNSLPMTSLSSDFEERAKKTSSLILRSMHSVGQVNVADGLRVSESWVSKWKTEELDRTVKLLLLCGLKLVPSDVKCFHEKDIEALMHGAQRWLGDLTSSTQLSWE